MLTGVVALTLESQFLVILFILDDCLVSWKTKKRATVARSTAKVEYRAMATTIVELLWIFYVLLDFEIVYNEGVPLFCDNQSTIQMFYNPTHHEKSKHVDIYCHFARNHVQLGFLNPTNVPSAQQLANVFTNPLGPSVFLDFLLKLNMNISHVKFERGVLKMELYLRCSPAPVFSLEVFFHIQAPRMLLLICAQN